MTTTRRTGTTLLTPMAAQIEVLDTLHARHTAGMTRDDQAALAKLDLFIAPLAKLRDLVAAGIIDAELAYRASQDERGLACCWCGYDMTEHDDESGQLEGAIAHPFSAAGTKSIAWLLDVPGQRELFPHDHDRLPDPTGICIRCRIDDSGTPSAPTRS